MNVELIGRTVFVTPHSTAPDALAATARTIEGLPGGAIVARDPDGTPSLDTEGRMLVASSDPGFLLFAVKQQGYALHAVEGEPST